MRLTKIGNAFLILGVIFTTSALAQDNLSYSGDAVTTRAVMQDLSDLYLGKRRVGFDLELASSSDAIIRAATGEIDLGGSARTARSEVPQEKAASLFPIAWDALTVIVNTNNPINNLSLPELIRIYRREITDWSEVGGSAGPIELVALQDPYHAVNYNLTELLMGKPGDPIPATSLVSSVVELENQVQQSPNAIAVTTYSGARSLPIKIISLDRISANSQSIRDGSYPLYMPLYLVSSPNSRNRRQIRDFLNFAAGSDAKRILRRNGLIPYSDALTLASQQLDRAARLSRVRDELAAQ